MGTMYDKIYALCEKKGVKPGTVCREIGISRSILTEIKSGRTKELSARNAKLFADYFNVSVDFFLSDGEKEKPLINDDEELTDYLEMLKNRPECRMLFQLSKDASAEDVKEAVRIIEAIRKKE